MMVHVGVHLTLGSEVCFVALGKGRISMFPVTQPQKTRVISVYYEEKCFSLCTHITHVCMHVYTRQVRPFLTAGDPDLIYDSS